MIAMRNPMPTSRMQPIVAMLSLAFLLAWSLELKEPDWETQAEDHKNMVAKCIGC